MPEQLTIGGQAVLEGVMIRSPHAFTVAVRRGGSARFMSILPAKR